MKNRTALDLIASMDRVRKHYNKRYGRLEKLMSALVRYGIESSMSKVFHTGIPKRETDRMALEVQWYKAPQNRQALRNLMREWNRAIDTLHGRLDKIRQIQIACGISGIEVEEKSLGDEAIAYFGRSNHLPWIESDLPKLREWKDRIAQFFIRQSEKSGHKFYRVEDSETLEVLPIEILMSVAAMGDWCQTWDSGEGQYNLVLGSGLDADAYTDSIWWVSTAGTPVV